MKVKVYMEVCIPRVPNFLHYGNTDGHTVDVAHLSDDELDEIGKSWTSQLIQNAQKRRNRPQDLRQESGEK
jgi:hypothetical protein